MSSKGGAPIGNKNAARKPFADAIDRALMKRSKVDQADALLKVAEQLITAAESGDMQAIKELADRTDGKASQAIAVNVTEMSHEEWLQTLK